MTSYQEAEKVRQKFARKLRKLSWEATLGSDTAAIKLIQTMTEQNLTLHSMGWMLNEDDKKPRLIPFVPVKEEDLTEQQKLLRKMRNGYNPTIEEWKNIL